MSPSDRPSNVLTDPDPAQHGDDEGRLVVTLSPPAARKARVLARHLDVRVPEVIRRGLALVALAASLGDGEYLAVRRANGDLERIVLVTD